MSAPVSMGSLPLFADPVQMALARFAGMGSRTAQAAAVGTCCQFVSRKQTAVPSNTVGRTLDMQERVL